MSWLGLYVDTIAKYAVNYNCAAAFTDSIVDIGNILSIA